MRINFGHDVRLDRRIKQCVERWKKSLESIGLAL